MPCSREIVRCLDTLFAALGRDNDKLSGLCRSHAHAKPWAWRPALRGPGL